ncbi:MAG: hypothetical protein Kow00121_30620 [Elainellaceae cyanobacterium]
MTAKRWSWDRHDLWSALTALALVGVPVGAIAALGSLILMGGAAYKYITSDSQPPASTVEYHYDVEVKNTTDASTDCRFSWGCSD